MGDTTGEGEGPIAVKVRAGVVFRIACGLFSMGSIEPPVNRGRRGVRGWTAALAMNGCSPDRLLLF